MLRCAEFHLSDEALDSMSMGMVYDMVTEKSNDRENYDIKGEPGQMAAFFRGESNGY